MDLNKKICYCFNVTVGDIKKEVETGSTTLAEIQTGRGITQRNFKKRDRPSKDLNNSPSG